jgi:hypothetical protein
MVSDFAAVIPACVSAAVYPAQWRLGVHRVTRALAS